MPVTDVAPARLLESDEACELAAAWVTNLAEERGIRMLVIKGATLAHHGLRPPRTSADVDVLVDPERFEQLRSAIVAGGWRERALTEVGAVWAGHSLTYFHDTWPCDIDVHRYFPGFLEDPRMVFETLWSSRASMLLAHQYAQIPSRNASLLISALHQLRDGQGRADNGELTGLTRVELDGTERAELVALATQTGAIGPIHELLLMLGFRGEDIPAYAESTELVAWRARIDADASGAFFWMLLLERTPLTLRAGVLARAVWPTRRDLLINAPGTPDTAMGRTAARLARVPKGLRSMPRAIRAIWARRRAAHLVGHSVSGK